jgi:hypothetical protein
LVIPKGQLEISKDMTASGAAGLSTAVVGVFNGVFYTLILLLKSQLSKTTTQVVSINPSQGDITAFVVDDPDAVFLIDADEAFTRADLL